MNHINTTAETDNIIVQQVMNGDKNSENILYEKYYNIIKTFLMFKYPKNRDIDDDVSEIIIKIFNKLGQFDPNKSKFKSWTLIIAKNHMIDKWRCNINSPYNTNNTISIDSTYNSDENYFDGEHYSGTILFNNDTYSVSCSNDFENNDIIKFISEQISPADYTLLNMKYIQGYDYKEIGEEFNLTSTTVSNRVNYIKSKIKNNNTDLSNCE